MEKYTWVDTHKAIAEKLLEYEGNQDYLIQILKDSGESVLKDIDDDEVEIELKEIDPFTFFCYLYKYGVEKRLEQLRKVAETLKIEPLPEDESGIPSANAQKVWLFPWKKHRKNNEITRLWSFFKNANKGEITNEMLSDILKIKNTGRVKITEGLFYINPEKYLPINSQTIPYLDKVYGINPNFETWSEYENILQKTQNKTREPFYKISYEAWLWNKNSEQENNNRQDDDIKYWVYAPGRKAVHWEEFYANGIMAIGWDSLGDLNNYSSIEQITQKLKEIEGTTSSKRNDANANFDFKQGIRKGDIIIAKKGKRDYVGFGVVTSDYYYDSSREYYQKCRSVEWIKKGNWYDNEGDIVLKTLTDITKYPAYVTRLKLLLDINAEPKLTREKSLASNSNQPLNQILYGPPGTGKTYSTIGLALNILGEAVSQNNREVVKELFQEKCSLGQIVFTTFHQSLGYEDFIEGIKPLEPEKEGDPLIYKVVPGVFQKLCVDAAFSISQIKESKETEEVLDFSLAYDAFTEQLEERLAGNEPVTLTTKAGGSVKVDSISQQGNIIIMHHDGTRKYTVSKPRLTKLQKAIKSLDDVSNINDQFREIIGGSNSSAYWSVLNAIRKDLKVKPKPKELRTYTWEEKKEVVQSMKKEEFITPKAKPYILIIDEINRGNVSQIFGELITLIEEDKRTGKPEALTVTLPYSKEKFSVPPNLYIIGTMNTADRSVEALDTALRRRFSFMEMMPDYRVLQDKEGNDMKVEDISLKVLLKSINERLCYLLDEDHQIGHSFFLAAKTHEDLRNVFKNNIIPQLKEFFYNDHSKIRLVLGDGFVQKVDSHLARPKFAANDEDDFVLEKSLYKINEINDNFDILAAIRQML